MFVSAWWGKLTFHSYHNNCLSCIYYVPCSDETLGVCDVQNKIELLPQRCFHSSVGDGHLINHTKQLKCKIVKWSTKARYRVLWKYIIEKWLGDIRKIIFEDVTHRLIRIKEKYVHVCMCCCVFTYMCVHLAFQEEEIVSGKALF